GDFLGFLAGKGIEVDYTGLDLNPRLIEAAREKHPGSTFRVFDIDRDTLDGKFDYIVLCGVFNLRVEGLDETIRRTLKILFDHCTIGLAFNALSSHDPRKDFELHYVSPEEIFSFAVTHLSPYVSLRHDRMLYDFTLCIHREPNRFTI
ncbi:MAG TPA: class I SAM-dependent methyltransferase, partial [Dissulfurispiraceae bacterium]|nr:class I SAM-dependent methyltransferase [Dissulfurispiraceae bacterium]